VGEPVVMCLRTDGAAWGNPGPAGIGVVLQDDNGKTIEQHKESIGIATNNQAEYRALIKGLQTALRHRPNLLHVLLDSELLVKQLNGQYRVRSPHIRDLHTQAADLIRKFERVEVEWVSREWNRAADGLATQAVEEAQRARRVL